MLVVEHLHHYVFGHQFTINTDHSPLMNVFKKCLNEMSPRLQWLLLRLSHYEMNMTYVTQKNVPIAECLSRLIDVKTSEEDPTLDLQITNLGIHGDVKVDWTAIREHTMRDPVLLELVILIQRGWPESQCKVPDNIKPYFPYVCYMCLMELLLSMTGSLYQAVWDVTFSKRYMKHI